MLDTKLKEMIFKLYKNNPFNQTIGAELLETSEGFAKGAILKMEEKHLNTYQGMHGGCMYALADSICGIAAATCGKYVTTLNGTMNYLVAVKGVKSLYCEATTVRSGRTISVVDYKLLGEDGTLFATGTFHYYILENKFEES